MSLLVWLPLTKDNHNQGLLNLTPTNQGTISFIDGGKLGKCLSAGNSSQTANGISYNSTLVNELGTKFSASIWVKPLGNHVHYNGTFISSGDWNGRRWAFGVNQNNTQVDVFGDGHNKYVNCSVPVNQWTHLVCTNDNGVVKLYKNGEYVTTTTISAGLKSDAGGNFTVGRETYANGYFSFNGNINDVRIYNHILSPKEIEILSRGLVCHYPLNGGGRGGDNIISGTSPNEVQYTYPSSSYSDKFAKTSTIIPSASQYVLSFWAKSTHARDKVRAHWYSPNTTTKAESNQGSTSTSADGQIDFTLSDKWEKYWCVWTQSSTTAVKHFIFPRMFSQASGGATGTGTVSIKCVKLEEGNIPTPWIPNSADSAYTAMGYNSTTEYDVSGYGYNGTKNGTIAYLTDTPRYNVSTNIKGASSYIQIPNLTTTGFSNSYSFAWWGKVPSYQGYMMWGFSNGQRLNGIFNGNLWNTGDGANNPLYVPGTTTQVTVPTTKVWHHWVMTGDGTTCKVYQDGVLWGQAKTYKSISGTTIYINGWDAGTSYTYGDYQMSDFRIYATALSAAQVAELYNTAVSVANNGTLMGYELVEV